LDNGIDEHSMSKGQSIVETFYNGTRKADDWNIGKNKFPWKQRMRFDWKCYMYGLLT
jgi:hypothetical protein